MKKGILFFLFIPFIIFVFFISGPLGNNLSKSADYSIEEIASSLSNIDIKKTPVKKTIAAKKIKNKPTILKKKTSIITDKQINTQNKLRKKRLRAIKNLSKTKTELYCLYTSTKNGQSFYTDDPFFVVNNFMDSLFELDKEYYIVDSHSNKFNILNCYDVADKKYLKRLTKQGGYIPFN